MPQHLEGPVDPGRAAEVRGTGTGRHDDHGVVIVDAEAADQALEAGNGRQQAGHAVAGLAPAVIGVAAVYAARNMRRLEGATIAAAVDAGAHVEHHQIVIVEAIA